MRYFKNEIFLLLKLIEIFQEKPEKMKDFSSHDVFHYINDNDRRQIYPMDWSN